MISIFQRVLRHARHSWRKCDMKNVAYMDVFLDISVCLIEHGNNPLEWYSIAK